MLHRLPTLSVAGSAALMAVLTLASCGGDDEPAVCSSFDSLKASIADLKDVDIDQNALTTLQDSFREVQSDLGKVKSDAKAEFGDDVDAVEQAASSVGSSLDAAIASPSGETVAAVGIAVKSLGTSLTSLEDALKNTC